MSKYKALFVEESREHVAEMSRLLVALEKSAEPAELVDEIFRHAHSVKGMAASMDFDAIVQIAHRMEDVVGARRESGATFEPAVVDLLLRAVDAMSAQVEAVAADAAIEQHDELVVDLSAAVGTPPPPTEPPPKKSKKKAKKKSARASKKKSKSKKAAAVEAAPEPKASDGRVVVVFLAEDASAPGVRLFMAHKKLAELGSIVAAVPTVEAMRGGKVSEGEARLTIVSEVGDDALREAASSVTDVARVEVETASADEMAAAAPVPAAEPAATENPAGPESPADNSQASATVRVKTDTLDKLIDNVGELFILREQLDALLAGAPQPDVRSALDSLGAQIRDLHSQVLTVRMTPMHTLTDRYPRLVRDLARSLDKEVELTVEGSEIEVDRAILDSLDEPLVHTLRNAIDHGVESPEERAAAGKPRMGSVSIHATRDRDTVVLIIEDDGRGLDAELLKRHAIERGIVSAEQAGAMSAREAYFLICTPGFSTKGEVTGVSGRGVGMDAVRAKIESLGGSLDIEAELGIRTRFLFRLPLTVAIINTLLVEADRRVFSIPVTKVVAVRDADEEVIREAGGNTYLSFRHALAPIFNLATILGLDSAHDPEHVVVIEDGRELLAVAVDRVVGYHEVVVKPLGDPLDRLEWFSGATILGDGMPILILDLPKALRTRMAA